MNLKEKFDLSKLSLDEIAKSIGKGKSTVCAVINGEYKSAKSELYQKAIENIIDEKISKNALNFDSGVWLSDMQKVIKKRISLMMESNLSFFELVLGESGSGKTFLIKEICKNDKSCLYVKARRSLSAAAFLSLIIRAMGEKPKGNSDEKLEMIFELLRQKDIKMLFVDEADLFVRDNDYTFERKFELLREIYEYSKMNNLGITVISVGLNELKRRIDKLGGYLKSRLTYSPEVSFNTQELKKIAALNGICDDENTVFLCEKIMQECLKK